MKLEQSSSEILNHYINFVSEIQSILPNNYVVGVADREKYLYLMLGDIIKIQPNISVGSQILKDDAIYIAIQKEEIVESTIPESVYGFPLKVRAVPIKDSDGNVIGGFSLAMNIENREELLNATNLIGISTDQAFNSVEKLSTLAGKLANHQSILRNLSKEIETSISETKNIIEFIQGISKTTKILSFNAAIESSKAGEAGRGFSVVSSEMRKMAENTGSSAKNIELVLENIKAKIFEISKEIDKTANISEQQEDIAEEISSIINELVSSTEILNKSASKYN